MIESVVKGAKIRRTCWLALACAVGFCLVPHPSPAASGTWTATGAGQVGYWTNDANWSASPYPGSGAGESAYLTNSTANTYTNIFNTTVANTISTLAISNTGGGQAWLIVTNATLTNTTFGLNTGGRLRIDNGGAVTGITSFTWRGSDGLLNINSGSLHLASGSLVMGLGSGSDNNRMIVNGGTLNVPGQAFVAAIRVGQLGNGNSLVLSNAIVNSGSAGNAAVQIGAPYSVNEYSYNCSITVGSGTYWNLNSGNLDIGSDYNHTGSSTATGNVLTVDGGTMTNVGQATFYKNYNKLIVTNGGKIFMLGSCDFKMGPTGNVTIISGTGSYVRVPGWFYLNYATNDGSAGNSLLIRDGGCLSVGGGGLKAKFYGGSVRITGIGTTNSTPFDILGTLNSILVDSGAYGGTIVDWQGTSNTVTVTGSGTVLAGPPNIGNAAGSCYNTMTVSNGAYLNSGYNGMSVGNASGANSNTLYIGGEGLPSTCLQQYNDYIGNIGSTFNTLILTNATWSRNGNTWGMYIAGPSNSIIVTKGGAWDGGSVDSITVGAGASTNSAFRVTAGGIVTNLIGLRVGNNAAAIGNRATIDGGSVFAGFGPGYANPGAYILAGTDNQLIVQNGGVLDSYLMSVAAGTGNMITNSGGIYQFNTATPTITTNGNPEGSIFINGGTISFRGIGSGLSLTNNWGPPFNRMTWLGDNALRLNGSTASSPAGGYTFNTGLGATNYFRLELVNGTAAVTGSGNPVTIGANGSLLVSNSAATISGTVTNFGTAQILSGSLTCSSNLTLDIGSTTVIGLAAMTNGYIKVLGTFTAGGALTVTNATGFPWAANSWNLFDWSGGPIAFAATNLPALSSAFRWDTSQLNSSGILTLFYIPAGTIYTSY